MGNAGGAGGNGKKTVTGSCLSLGFLPGASIGSRNLLLSEFFILRPVNNLSKLLLGLRSQEPVLKSGCH